MKTDESYEIETAHGQDGGSGLPGQRPPSSGVGKVIFGLLLALVVAGFILYRGVTTRVRASEA